MKTKWNDICKAVKEYKEENSYGHPRYAELMYDSSDGEIWCDTFSSIGYNEWKVYHSDTIFNLGKAMNEEGLKITAHAVKKYLEEGDRK